jgi:hypothetical protein
VPCPRCISRQLGGEFGWLTLQHRRTILRLRGSTCRCTADHGRTKNSWPGVQVITREFKFDARSRRGPCRHVSGAQWKQRAERRGEGPVKGPYRPSDNLNSILIHIYMYIEGGEGGPAVGRGRGPCGVKLCRFPFLKLILISYLASIPIQFSPAGECKYVIFL